MSPLKRISWKHTIASVDRFFFAPMSAEPIALLRIFLGIMMLVEAFHVYPYLDDLYGPFGFMQAKMMRAIEGPLVPFYSSWFENSGYSYSQLLHAFYAFRLAILFMFTFGFFTRSSTIFLSIAQSLIMNSGVWSSYGVDRYFLLLLFLLIWCPAGNAWSIDRWFIPHRPRETDTARFAFRLLQLCVLITYLDAGVSKATGSDWWNGEAIWRVTNLPDFAQADFFWLAAIPWLPKVLGWSTLLFETFYIVAVWIPRIAPVWTLTIIGMHLGIAMFMGLVNFGITMALINVSLFLYPWLKQKTSDFHPRFLLAHYSI